MIKRPVLSPSKKNVWFMFESIVKKLKNMLKEKHFGEIFKGSIITFAANIVVVLLGLILNLVIARYYGAKTLGIISLIMSYMAIVSLFSTFGLNTSLLRLIPEQLAKYTFKDAKDIIFKSTQIIGILSLTVTCILLLNTKYIAVNFYNEPKLEKWLFFATFLIIALNISSINTTVIRALKEINAFALLQIIQPAINVALLVVITVFVITPDNPIYTYFISIFLGLIISSWFVFKSIRNKQKVYMQDFNATSNQKAYTHKQLIKISWPMFLTGAMWVLTSQVDIVMLGAFTSTENVGIYAVVIKLGMMITFILTSINMVLAPKFAELYYSNDLESLRNVAQKSSKIIFYTTIPLLLILIIFGKPILSLFGSEFIFGYWALVFVALGQFVNTICGSTGYFMNMTGNQKEFNKIMMFATLLNIILNYILIPIFGIVGAAISSLACVIYWNLGTVVFIKRKYNFYIGYKY